MSICTHPIAHTVKFFEKFCKKKPITLHKMHLLPVPTGFSPIVASHKGNIRSAYSVRECVTVHVQIHIKNVVTLNDKNRLPEAEKSTCEQQHDANKLWLVNARYQRTNDLDNGKWCVVVHQLSDFSNC